MTFLLRYVDTSPRTPGETVPIPCNSRQQAEEIDTTTANGRALMGNVFDGGFERDSNAIARSWPPLLRWATACVPTSTRIYLNA